MKATLESKDPAWLFADRGKVKATRESKDSTWLSADRGGKEKAACKSKDSA